MDQTIIRVAREADAAALAAIYAPYVTDTAVTFAYAPPSASAFARQMTAVLARYPYLAAERDGELIGYAYAGPFQERPAYGWSVETTIYIRRDRRRTGAGRALYGALEQALSLQGILNLNACIACPAGEDPYLTRDSIRFHGRQGYRLVGEFRQCGYKFGRWYNMVWMEKHIGAHGASAPAFRPFDAVREELVGWWDDPSGCAEKRIDKNRRDY